MAAALSVDLQSAQEESELAEGLAMAPVAAVALVSACSPHRDGYQRSELLALCSRLAAKERCCPKPH